MTNDQKTENNIEALIELLHVKTNVAVSLANICVSILRETQIKQSSNERIRKHVELLNEEIGKATVAYEQKKSLSTEEIYHRSYKEGMNDALFDPTSHTKEQLIMRNKRIHDNQKWLGDHIDGLSA